MRFLLEFLLFRRLNRAVAERRAPIGRALEDRQVTGLGRDGLNDLDGRRATANDANALAAEIDRLLRPARAVE